MMKNKNVIVFLESGFFFSQLICENGAFGAPVRAPGGLGRPDLVSKDDPRQYPFQRALVCSSV
jgi:hypothetical protein